MADSRQSILTMGHSSLEPERFLELLRHAHVQIVGDVRSRPQSARFPQFSQAALENILRSAGMDYVFLGEELGGRPGDSLGRDLLRIRAVGASLAPARGRPQGSPLQPGATS